jgi:hypothetical protein
MNLSRLLLALAMIAAQLAPAIHAITPHEEELAHCTHENAGTHLERHDFHHHEAPCSICVFAAGRAASVDSAPVATAPADSAVVPVVEAFKAVDPVLALPDSRGPPIRFIARMA